LHPPPHLPLRARRRRHATAGAAARPLLGAVPGPGGHLGAEVRPGASPPRHQPHGLRGLPPTATSPPLPKFVIPNSFRDPSSRTPGALGRSAASAAGTRNPRGKLGALAIGSVPEEKWVPKRVRDDGKGRVVSFPGDRGSARPLHRQPQAVVEGQSSPSLSRGGGPRPQGVVEGPSPSHLPPRPNRL